MQSNSDETRPAIWAEGSQKPAFEPRAFVQAALKIGREAVAGILSRCGTTAGEVGDEMKAGRLRIPEDRLGRTGRYLPTAERTGRAVLGGAGILRRAAEVAQPNAWAEPPREVDPAYRDLFRYGQDSAAKPQADLAAEPMRSVAVAAPAATAHHDGDSPDELAAIRTMMKAAEQEQETAAKTAPRFRAAASSQPDGTAEAQPLLQGLRAAVGEGAARVLGYWMIAFAFPYGAIRAGIKHLNGEDLRKKPGAGE